MAKLKDVAAAAGVSMSTASRAISGQGPLSAHAAARVEEAIRALNYRPSSIGRALASRSIGLVGVFVPALASPKYGTILQEAEKAVRSAGRHLVVTGGWGEMSAREQAIHGIRFLIDRDCDGILALSHDLTDDDVAALRQLHGPLVFLDRDCNESSRVCFSPDHVSGGSLAARKLIENGHHSVAIVVSRDTQNQAAIEGFRSELSRSGRCIHELITIAHAPSPEREAALDSLIGRAASYTGIFCDDADIAAQTVVKLRAAGFLVPTDVSVVAYDYGSAGSWADVACAYVPLAAMARSAARWLTNQCYGTSWAIEGDFAIVFVEGSTLAKSSSVRATAKHRSG
ncbi:LacI family DNA-binding transcriptional regulator [Caballeronia udeis]|nr:LacI family DNA-binding transcriptional regulator [Caballeronia udeis]